MADNAQNQMVKAEYKRIIGWILLCLGIGFCSTCLGAVIGLPLAIAGLVLIFTSSKKQIELTNPQQKPETNWLFREPWEMLPNEIIQLGLQARIEPDDGKLLVTNLRIIFEPTAVNRPNSIIDFEDIQCMSNNDGDKALDLVFVNNNSLKIYTEKYQEICAVVDEFRK